MIQYSDETCRFVAWLIDNPGKIKSIVASNPAGVLWEKLWKFEGDQFWVITIASGVYDVWHLLPASEVCKSIEGTFQLLKPPLAMLQQERPKMIRPDTAYIVIHRIPDES